MCTELRSVFSSQVMVDSETLETGVALQELASLAEELVLRGLASPAGDVLRELAPPAGDVLQETSVSGRARAAGN